MNSYNLKELEERSKLFESFNNERLIDGLPVICRLDGNNFSSFTKGLKQPYDERLSRLMIETCKYAVKETNAKMGFVGSDEITLVLYSNDFNSQIYYNGVKRKILSILPSKLSVFFNKKLEEYLPEKKDKSPSFDCRVWNVPTLEEACNSFYVRERSVHKNAITMACLANKLYSHKQIEKVNGKDKQEMLFKKGVNFNDYPVHYKRGIYVQKRKIKKSFTPDEIDKLPLKHEARTNPNLMIERSEIREIELPIFSKIINPVETVFEGSNPKTT